MGATKDDIFGDARAAQPASPGSYGEHPRAYRLPGATRLGEVRLQIADLGRSLEFYERTLGLRVLEREGSKALLSAQNDEAPLVELQERRGALPAPRRGRLGLFHFALLLPDRAALGQFLRHLGEIDARAGSADHLVSEALYLQDPDNLGIEVYADRPRIAWHRVGRELMMATDPLDVAGLVGAAEGVPWTGMPAGTRMGHVHLHVGDLGAGAEFYSEALGFDRTVWEYPGALFMSSGGYHHHLGTNTWAGPAATAPEEGDARLLEWTIELPGDADVEAVAVSLSHGGYAVDRDSQGRTLVTRDPWGTQVRLRSAAG